MAPAPETPSTSFSTPAPASSGNVQYQLEITSVIKTVSALGVQGLKMIQMSGVDIHTIGCLEALGEITPASSAFRTKLQNSRAAQRSKRWLLYALVEYGSGTNAVVDQFLTVRAGENILSLMVALCSVLENGAIEALSALYDRLQVPPKSTPSISQLQRVRQVCLPLTRLMDFKDRVLWAHQHILQLAFTQRPDFAFPDVVPGSKTIAELVVALKHLCTGGSANSRLIYYGIRGAAWLVAYSREVLGLGVCIVGEDGSTFPVNCSYETASVVVLPAHAGGETERLQRLEAPTDVIALSEDQQKLEAMSWFVSCGEGGSDFFQLTAGWNLGDRLELGNLTFSIAKEYVEHRIHLGDMAHAKRGTPYYAIDPDVTLQNLRVILGLLGLPGPLNFIPDWRQAHFEKSVDHRRKVFWLKLKLFSRMEPDSGSPSNCTACPPGAPRLRPEELGSYPKFCVQCKLQRAVLGIAYRASCLAFTDWAEHNRHMALGSAGFGRKYFEHVYDKDPNTSTDQATIGSQPPPESLTLNDEVLVEELLTFLAGTRIAFDRMEDVKKKFIGVDLDGVLLLNRRAIEPTLEPGPVFIIREGEFSLGGERRRFLWQVPWYAKINTPSPYHFIPVPGGDNGPVENSTVALRTVTAEADKWEEERLRIRSSLSVEASLTPSAIRLSYIVKMQYPLAGGSGNGGTISGVATTQSLVRVGDILDNLQMLKVTTPCPHPSDMSLPVTVQTFDLARGKKTVWWKDESGWLWRAYSIPYDDETHHEPAQDAHSNEKPVLVMLHDVGHDAVAQWFAVANSRAWEGPEKMGRICILQRDCCLPCTAKQAREWVKDWPISDSERRRIRIIAFPA